MGASSGPARLQAGDWQQYRFFYADLKVLMLWALAAVQAALTRQKQQYEDEMAALRSKYDQQIESAAAKHRAELEVRTTQRLHSHGKTSNNLLTVFVQHLLLKYCSQH